VKYSHLVANLVMLHTLDSMTRVLSDLRSEGQVIDEELLRGLSPYRTMHINRFGDYRLDLSRRTRDPTLDVARIEAQGRDPLESPPESLG
jgi:hypothetical protein